MKKLFNLALFSVIALTGAVGFSACSSSSDEVIDNPDYDPETNSVKTQFAISLQDNVLNSKTRMSADEVQQGGTLAQFKGITGMVLLPFNATSITTTTPLNGSFITLSPDIDATTSGTAAEKVKVYSNVNIHTETNRFLFYGQAKSGAEGFNHGALKVPTDFSTLGAIQFEPKPINATINTSGTQYAVCTNLLELMTSVANAKAGTITWGPAGDGETRTTIVALQSMYDKFITMEAGSSQMIKDALEDIYNELNTMATTDTDPGYALAGAIRTAILASNANSVSGTAGSQTLTLGAAYQGYPGNLNLPDGAAHIQWNATTKGFEDISLNGTSTVTPLNHYAYPANIQYFVESPIKTLTSQVLTESDDWTTNLAKYTGAGAGTSVSSTTRSVALETPIKYGVGRFDVTVAALKSGTYYDKNSVAVDVTNGFTLKGIIVGGQKPVDFKFAQTTGQSYTIYDKVMPTSNSITTSTGTGKNYTLVLQNAPNDDNGVNFALELINNGADFQGKDGIIPAGGTFYLVGNLKPAAATNAASASADIKDYVFKQDYYTEATCTIDNTTAGSSGLANATNCLPDLTAPTMELGFSVDLTWKAGLNFNVKF